MNNYYLALPAVYQLIIQHLAFIAANKCICQIQVR